MGRIIPDIINCKPEDNFTQIRNSILRDNDISLKAKGLLALLLSNKEGWYSYSETIKNFTSDGEASIRTALRELEDKGYLLRVRYRDKHTKVIRGGFWAYTDVKNEFNLEATLIYLEDNNFEIAYRTTENPSCGKASRRYPKTNNTNIKKLTSINFSEFDKNSHKKEEILNSKEQYFKDKVMEQIKEVLEIPELMELATPSFIKTMKEYVPTKKELSYFIENFTPELLLSYREYLIHSLMEENLFKNNEMITPRIALLNTNPVRRSHLIYSAENTEDIEFSLKRILKIPQVV